MSQYRPGGFQLLPTIVKNLLIINGLVFFLQVVLEQREIDLADYAGLHYYHSPLFKPWQPLTHMFLHGSFMHLFSNMFALWMFGATLENAWGPRRFLLYYLICGLGAALLHTVVITLEFNSINDAVSAFQQNPTVDQFLTMLRQNDWGGDPNFSRIASAWQSDPSSDGFSGLATNQINRILYGQHGVADSLGYPGIFNTATVGASGAVFGLLFAFGYLFPDTLLYFYFFFPLKAKYFVALYAAFELFAGFRNSASDNVAHFAHIGGMIVGFFLLRAWGIRRYARRY